MAAHSRQDSELSASTEGVAGQQIDEVGLSQPVANRAERLATGDLLVGESQ